VTPPPVAGLGPVDPGQRIEAIDMIRGFALFGVLLVNIYNFGASSPVWTEPIDQYAFAVKRVLFETKSWRLFSFLFGLGFSLQLLRAQALERRFAGTYLRRLAILFVIGMVHALFYDGDVLMLYAELGLLLALFRNAPPRLVLVLAVALLAVFPVGRAMRSVITGDTAVIPSERADLDAARVLIEERRQTHPYSVGSLADVMKHNARFIPPLILTERQLGPESDLAYFAMFLLGLYAGRRGIFHEMERHLPLVRGTLRWGLAIGVLAMTVERILTVGWGYQVFGRGRIDVPLEFIGDFSFAYGSTALCFGYAAAIALMARNVRLRPIVQPLGPVGRMALTVYLTQTLAFTTLFYGYGLGQAYRMGPAAVTASAVLIFGLQILGCAWWVKRYRYGPAEWLWRGLTYMAFPRMRQNDTSPQEQLMRS
jgi:uncharacterized protein